MIVRKETLLTLVYWWFYVTGNDISVIYITTQICAVGQKKIVDLRSGPQRHRHFVWFLKVSVQNRHRAILRVLPRPYPSMAQWDSNSQPKRKRKIYDRRSNFFSPPVYIYVPSHIQQKYLCISRSEKKEEIWLSPMTKAPTPTEKSKKQRDNIKTPQKLRLHNDCGPT